MLACILNIRIQTLIYKNSVPVHMLGINSQTDQSIFMKVSPNMGSTLRKDSFLFN